MLRSMLRPRPAGDGRLPGRTRNEASLREDESVRRSASSVGETARRHPPCSAAGCAIRVQRERDVVSSEDAPTTPAATASGRITFAAVRLRGFFTRAVCVNDATSHVRSWPEHDPDSPQPDVPPIPTAEDPTPNPCTRMTK